MDRRSLIRSVSCCCALLALRTHGLEAQFPPGQSRKESSPHAEFNGRSIAGCSLSNAQAADLKNEVKLLRTCGNAFVDRGFGIAYPMLNNAFTVRPGFAFFDDSDSPNAFATPEQLTANGPGTVIFGTRLLGGETSSAPGITWGSALTLILAHEWSHILQYQQNFEGDSPHRELHADCMGGWFLGIYNKRFPNGIDVGTAARSIFRKGDFAFNSPTHHGTPEERVSAVLYGYKMVAVGTTNILQAFHQAANRINAG